MVQLSRRAAALAAVAGSAFLLAPAARAQDAAGAAASTGTANLGEIVVTAERRSENLQKVPISVGVISGAGARDYQAAGDDTLLSLSGKVPSLYIESTTGRIFPRFYIRGLGNIDFYLGASQPVSIVQDDVVLEHVVLKSNPVFDVQQIEVLRGPQGSLFGRNTTAGIIKFDTIRPTQDYEGRIAASYGSRNSVNVDGGFGGPIVQDKLAFRASVLYQRRDDWVDNSFTGVSDDGTRTNRKNALGGFEEKDARLQLLLTPNEHLSILASGHARDYSGTSTIFYRGSITKGTNAVPDGLDRSKVALDEGLGNPQAYHTYGGSLKIANDFGLATLTSITAYETTHGYSRGDTDGGNPTQLPAGFSGESQGRVRSLGQWTQELRLSNSDKADRLSWQIGGFFFDSRDTTEFDQRTYFLNGAARNPNNWVLLHDSNVSWAMFGQVSYKLTDRLTITAGGRETKDSKQTNLLRVGSAGFPATAARNVNLSTTKPSWDVSALYQLTPEIGLYGRIAHGFRGPTIQGRSAVFGSAFTTANAETITSYEGGIKTQFLGDRLRLNLTGFTYVVHDIQLNGNDEFGNGVLFNADKAKAYGMEAEAELRPVRNLTLSAGLSLLHTEIDDKRVYAQVCGYLGTVYCTVENPTIKVGTNTFAQIDGNVLPDAPKYNLDLTARYDLPIGRGKAFVSTDWNIQGYTSFVAYKTKEFSSNGNFEGGVKVGYAFDSYEIAAFARNVTNEKNLKGVIENFMAGVYNDPRTVGVSLSAAFR